MKRPIGFCGSNFSGIVGIESFSYIGCVTDVMKVISSTFNYIHCKHICGGGGTRTPKGVNPAVFKTAALPIRTTPPAKNSAGIYDKHALGCK